MTGDSFLECAEKNSVWVSIRPECHKTIVQCNADIQIILAFSSTVHLHSKKPKRFSVDAFVLCCHKVFYN